jgi:hypothetical protein
MAALPLRCARARSPSAHPVKRVGLELLRQQLQHLLRLILQRLDGGVVGGQRRKCLKHGHLDRSQRQSKVPADCGGVRLRGRCQSRSGRTRGPDGSHGCTRRPRAAAGQGARQRQVRGRPHALAAGRHGHGLHHGRVRGAVAVLRRPQGLCERGDVVPWQRGEGLLLGPPQVGEARQRAGVQRRQLLGGEAGLRLGHALHQLGQRRGAGVLGGGVVGGGVLGGSCGAGGGVEGLGG